MNGNNLLFLMVRAQTYWTLALVCPKGQLLHPTLFQLFLLFLNLYSSHHTYADDTVSIAGDAEFGARSKVSAKRI